MILAAKKSVASQSPLANDEVMLAGDASAIRKGLKDEEDVASAADNGSGELAILSLLSESSNEGKELQPMLKSGSGIIVYNLGSGFEVAYEKLRQSEKKGLLQASGFLAFPACPKCESLDLQIQLYCPECSSQDLIKSDLLIHYECQTTGPIEEFQSKIRNGYYCQKCRKELKRVGIDYGNPGIGFKCSSCEKVFQFPLVLSRCDSGHTSKIDSVNLKSYPKYTLGGNAKGLSPLLVESRALKTALEKENIHSKVLATLKGASGANHVVPLLLTLPPKQREKDVTEQLAIEFINDESNLEKSVLQLLLKSADLDKIKMIIIYKGSTSVDHIKAIVNPKKVKVLPSTDDFGQLPELIVKEVKEW